MPEAGHRDVPGAPGREWRTTAGPLCPTTRTIYGLLWAGTLGSEVVQTCGMRSPQLLSSYRAGRRLKVCSRTLRRYVQLGILNGHFERGQWRYPAADVEFLRRYGPPHQCGKAAASLLGIGVRRLRHLTRQGVIAAQRTRTGHIYARDDLLSFRDELMGRARRLSKRHQTPKIRAYSRSWKSVDVGGEDG